MEIGQLEQPPKRPHLSNIRTRNRALLLEHLLRDGARTRHELVQRTGLTHASVSRITKELIARGICYEGRSVSGQSRLGRRQVELQINPDGGFVIAVCLSAFSRLIAVTDLVGHRRHQVDMPKRAARSAKAAATFIAQAIDNLAEDGVFDRQRLLGAGLAIAGYVDPASGYLIKAPLLGWRDYPLGDRLSELLGCAVRVENIADSLCLTCLHQSHGSDCSNIFLAHVAIGMGASLAIDRRIVRRRGDEAWIGRVPVSNSFKRGKALTRLDRISSGQAVLDEIERRGIATFHGQSVTERLTSAVDLANRNDGPCSRIFRKAGEALGGSLLPLTAAYLPDLIVLAGPTVTARPFHEGAIDGYTKAASGTDAETTDLIINRARYIDAAESLALRKYVYSGLALPPISTRLSH